MIKEIKTEKFEGLAVLVPDDAHGFFVHPLMCILGWTDSNGSNFTNLEYNRYEIIGKATELTEEQCAEIVPIEYVGWLLGDIFKNYINHSSPFSDSKQSFKSLMQSLGCYSVNPIPVPELQGNGIEAGYCETWVKQYEQSQSTTGTWLILKKL